jgi:hypothetical protein
VARWKPLPGDLEPQAGELVVRLRELKDRLGISTAALARKTAYGRSSWDRYLNARTLPPRHAVEALARLAGADTARLLAVWELAAYARDRRSPEARSGTRHQAGMAVSPAASPAEPGGTARRAQTGTALPPETGTALAPDTGTALPPETGASVTRADDGEAAGLRRRQRWQILVPAGIAVLTAIGMALWMVGADRPLSRSSHSGAASVAPTGYRCEVATRDGHRYAGHSATADRLVVRGSAGEDVVEVQCLLKQHGLDPGRIDGVFGERTEAAVSELQRAGGAVPDGKVGPQTWPLLRA